MLTNEDQFIRDAEGLNIDDAPRAAHRQDLKRRMLAVHEQSLSQTERPRSADRPLRIGRWTVNKRIASIAAAVLVAACATGMILLLTTGGADVAWADVQDKIRNTRTFVFTMSVQMEGQPEYVMRVMFLGPGRMRQETIKPDAAKGVVNIFDLNKEKMICLVPQQKLARTADLSAFPEEVRKKHLESAGPLSKVKEMIKGAETELGEKEIDGRKAKGYEVEKDGHKMTVWVDAKTAVPIEMTTRAFGDFQVTMSDFELNKKLDESLFSVEPPEGWKVEEFPVPKMGTVEDVVGLLRIWSKVTGAFPKGLTPDHLVKELVKREKECSKEDMKKLAGYMQQTVILLVLHPEARYAGEGVKVGDAKTAVFWYQPKDSETYKVVYGDLTVKDVAEDDLPADPRKPSPDDEADDQPKD